MYCQAGINVLPVSWKDILMQLSHCLDHGMRHTQLPKPSLHDLQLRTESDHSKEQP
jgi:hypothetical protein